MADDVESGREQVPGESAAHDADADLSYGPSATVEAFRCFSRITNHDSRLAGLIGLDVQARLRGFLGRHAVYPGFQVRR